MRSAGAKCGRVLGAVSAFVGLVPPVEADGVTVAAVAQEPAIVRQAPEGDERLIYLSIGNPGKDPLTGLKLTHRVGDRGIEREILDVPPGGAWDMFWVREPVPASLRARLLRGGEVLWSGELAVPPAGPDRVVIPGSPCTRPADLRPRVLRGTNYFPRVYPWPGLWRQMDEAAFDAEFAEMKKLHINTIRTFYVSIR